MKHFNMESTFLILIMYMHLFYVSTAEFNPITLQISNQSTCSDNNLFGQFLLSDVPEFGAMCNIDIPKTNQAKFLVENNPAPILCMGLYEVSIRICKAAISSSTAAFSEMFPPSLEKFSTLFAKFKTWNGYSPIDTFCNKTVKDYMITNSASNVSEFWWNLLNKQFSNTKNCTSICRTNKEENVHPLCSYIVWLNAIYINNLNSVSQTTDITADTLKNYVSDKPSTNQNNGTVHLSDSSALGINFTENMDKVEGNQSNTKEDPIINPVLHEESPNEIVNLTSVQNQKNKENINTETGMNTELEGPNNKLEDSKTPINPFGTNNLTKNLPDLNTESNENENYVPMDATPGENQSELFSNDGGGFGEDGDSLPEESLKATPNNNVFGKLDSNKPEMLSKDFEYDKGYGGEGVLIEDHFIEAEDSHFITYFLCLTVLFILFYLAFYSKKKLVALAVEGRRTRSARRRPNSSNYSKLNCSLEEALVSNTTASVTHVLY